MTHRRRTRGRNWAQKLEVKEELKEEPLGPFLSSLFSYKPGRIAIRIIYVVGKQRSGKSTMVDSIVTKAERAYPGGIYYLKTNDANDIYENFNPARPRNIFLVDDAGDMQFSHEQFNKASAEKILRQKRIAHLAEEAGIKEGCITVFYCAQNDTLVTYQLRRDASIYMIKCLNLTIDADRDLIKGLKNLDDYYRDVIDKWIMAVDAGEDWALSKALVILLNRRWGWFNFTNESANCKIDKSLFHVRAGKEEDVEELTPANNEFLKGLDLGAGLDMDKALSEIIGKMEKDQKWRDKIRCYALAREGRSQRDIAVLMLGDPGKQTTVSSWIKSSGAEAKRRLGAIYEKATEIRLVKAGWDARRDGANGRPDVLASKGKRELVISCKVYEDPKRLVSIEAGQFRPEINEARVKGLTSFVLFFYNLAWKAEIVRELDKDLNTATLRQSEASKPGDLKLERTV